MAATAVIKDKTRVFVSFLLPLLNSHSLANPSATSRPFFLGISGPQGSGKTTLVTTLAATLRSHPHSLNVVAFSLDDIYLTHADQVSLRELYPDNKLVRYRGEPGTHDIGLGKRVFQSLKGQFETKLPAYDKSAFGGQGDRVDEACWEKVQGPYDVVIFEGWCVGFRALSDAALEQEWHRARLSRDASVGRHPLEHLLFVNNKLKDYDTLTDSLDALINIDAEDISYIYDWRIQQEHGLISSRSSGMTDDQVIEFVDGCMVLQLYYLPGIVNLLSDMPAYELYVCALRQGAPKKEGRQLQVIIGKDRNIIKVTNL